MSSGLTTTLELLKSTDNEAAVQVLIPALDSPNSVIQEGALMAILRRWNPAGGREILNRLPKMKPEWKAIIRQNHGRLTTTLRDAILGTDPVLCNNACDAAILFHDYDLIPTLLSALEAPNRPNADIAAKTLLQMVDSLYDELAGARDASDRRDPQMVRRYVISSLEHSVQRYSQHRRREVVECFLLLVNRENVILKQILLNSNHPVFPAFIDVLSKSQQRGVIRLLMSFLDDVNAPSAAIAALSRRDDSKFVHHLLRKIGREPSSTATQNLKRVDSIPWLNNLESLLEHIDDAGQHAVVRLIMTAGISRQQAFNALDYILFHGKSGGRCEAARALAEFHGADANARALQALKDPDPLVQANIVSQLRGRGIPGVLPSLLELIESPYEVVRKAARESLAEFSFKRFLAAFDMLDEEVRRSTGLLVKRIDTQTVPQLREEMSSPVRTRRLRGIVIARTIEVVEPLEGAIIQLLEDEDHMVRVEAAIALAQSSTPASQQALLQATGDNSEAVRQAAQQSLREMAPLSILRE